MSGNRRPRFEPFKLIQTLVLVLFETTVIYLVGILLTGGEYSTLRWWIVGVVVAMSAIVTDWFEPINGQSSHIRPQSAAIAVLTIGWAVTWHIRADGGGFAAWRTFLDPDSPQFITAYTALIAATVGWWRGAQLLDIGHSDMVQRFRRAIIAVLLALVVVTVAGFGQGLTPSISTSSPNIPAWIIVLLMFGLLGLSITRITTVKGDGGRAAQWMWLRSSALSSALILVVGVVALSLVASPAGTLLRQVAAVVIYTAALLFSPVIWLAVRLLEYLRGWLLPQALEPVMPLATATALPDQPTPQAALSTPFDLLAFTTLLLLVIPVVVLLVLIYFANRRRSAPIDGQNEERESIFSWRGFGNDISNVLASLRRRRVGEGGLGDVLRSMVGQDPATRIRRRYVQMLLRGEAAEKRRRSDETPREFAPALNSIARDHTSLRTLTEAYERARYAPDSVDQAVAERADRAWQTLSDDAEKSD